MTARVTLRRPGSLWAFFALSYVAAWTLWVAAASVAAGRSLDPQIRALFFLPGTFVPGLVALALTARAEGRAGIDALLGRLLDWQVGARWYAFALGYMIAVKVSAAVAFGVLTGTWPAFGPQPVYLLLAAAIFTTPFQAGEEVGWRGYALPRLASRMGLANASVLLGILWASWHLPLFLIPETTTTGQSFPVYLLSVTALSVAMAWLYGHTRGSLLLMMLMHAAINNTKDVVPSGPTSPADAVALGASLMSWLTAALLWAVAAIFITRMARHNGYR